MRRAILLTLIIAIMLPCAAAAEETAGYFVSFLENQTTGYVWSYSISDETVLAVTDNGYQAMESNDGLVGSGGTHDWTITGLAAGDASVSFYYSWAWEEELADPQVVYTFSVDASGDLTLDSVEGMPEQYMSNTAIVQLRENPTTGYAWELSVEPAGILSVMSVGNEADDTDTETVGSGGMHTFVVQGMAPGTAVLTCNYIRSFEADDTPAATLNLTYMIDDALTVHLMGLDGDYDLYAGQ